MKKHTHKSILFTGTILGLSALFVAMPIGSTGAMNWASNAALVGIIQENPLNKIAENYKKHPYIEADFEFRYFRNAQDQTGTVESGTLLLDQKSGKYRITLPGQVLISDGKSQWAVLNDVDEVQVTEVDQSNNSINPYNVFSFFTEGYSHKILNAEQVGKTALQVIELIPTDKKKNFSKVMIRSHPKQHELYDVTVFDRNNSRYSYRIKSLKTNPGITEKSFSFNKDEFPGMEIVDLR